MAAWSKPVAEWTAAIGWRVRSKITVGEVLKLTERRKPATGSGYEVLAELWGQVDTAVAAIIDETMFADLAGRCSDIQTPSMPN